MRPDSPAAQEFAGEQELQFGRFRLDPQSGVLWRDEQILPLGPKVVHTLAILIARQGQIVSRDDLIRHVWGNTVVEENSLAHNISVLRKIFREDPSGNFAIQTVARRGYRFCAPVERTMPAVSSKPGEFELKSEVVKASPPVNVRLLMACGILLCIGIACAGVAGYRLVAKSSRRSVAVVGFANLSGTSEAAWISPALSEMLSTELGAGGPFLMIPEETVARARAELQLGDRNGFPTETLRKLRQDIDADLVITGAYGVLPGSASSDDIHQIRLDVRVQDTTNGKTLVVVNEVGEQSTLFEMVARAGAGIRQDLGVKPVTAEQLEQAKSLVSSSPRALRLHAEAVSRIRTFDTLGALDLLQEAVRDDPNYVAAHSALSDAFSDLGNERKSQEEARIALDLSGRLSADERLSNEGRFEMSRGNWEKAMEVYGHLAHLFPDHTDYGLQFASAEIKASKPQQALQTLSALRQRLNSGEQDARIGLKEYEAWKSLGDFTHMESALQVAAETAKKQGALLLLARARIRQCWVEQFLGEPEQALSNCREAQQVYTTVRHVRGEAESLRLTADILSASDVPAAFDYLRQALALDRQVGSLGDEANVLGDLASLQSGQGDHAEAKKLFEQSEAISQQLGDTLGATGMINNVAGELKALGQIEQAKKLYQHTLQAGRDMGNEYIVALAQYNEGMLQQSQGELESAEQFYKEAQHTFQQAGVRKYDIILDKSLGEVAALHGDVEDAQQLYEQALSLQIGAEEKLESAEAEMDLDQLLLDEGKPAKPLEPSIRRIVEAFRSGGPTDTPSAANDQALSTALLARCLLAEGTPESALKTTKQAVAMSAKAEPDTRLTVAIIAARIRLQAQAERTAASTLQELAKTISEAHRLGYVGIELEGRLTMGEMQIKMGEKARGRTYLQEVEREASPRGFALLARKAKKAA